MINACYKHPKCVAFTYIENRKICDLKTRAQAVSLFSKRREGIMSVKSPKTCRASLNLKNGQRTFDGDIRNRIKDYVESGSDEDTFKQVCKGPL